MAMTFTLVSHLRELLSKLSRSKKEEQDRLEKELERLQLEVRTRSIRAPLFRTNYR
jgi:cell division protein FtsL